MFSQLTSRTKVKEILPHFLFLSHGCLGYFCIVHEGLPPGWLFLWSALRSSVPCRQPQCAPQCLGTSTGLGHSQSWQQSQTPLPNVLVCPMHFWGMWDFSTQTGKRISQLNWLCVHLKFVTWPFLHQYFWKQLSIIMHCLASACSWWGKANIRTTSWQSQADAVWLYYWMQLIRNFSFSLWRYSPAPPQHSRLKRNLEFISKTTSNFLAVKESICKWE